MSKSCHFADCVGVVLSEHTAAILYQVLWDVSTAEGQKLYGEAYLDVWTIDMFHQVGASDINCDHLHGM